MRQDEQMARRGSLAAKYGWQLVFTLTLASFYLIGTVFRDGYLAHFHLEPSMFPVSVPTTYIESVWAFGNGLGALLDAIGQAARAHGLKIVLGWLGFGAVLGMAFFLKGVKKRFAPPKSNEERRWFVRLILASLKGWSIVAFGTALTLASIAALAIFLVMLVAPFTKMGTQVAAQEAARGFPISRWSSCVRRMMEAKTIGSWSAKTITAPCSEMGEPLRSRRTKSIGLRRRKPRIADRRS